MNRYNIFLMLIICFFSFYSQLHTLPSEELYTIDKLVNISKFIVQGKVIEISCYKGENGRIYSDIKFQILKVFKGKISPTQVLNFTFIGGTHGRRTTTVLEFPHFGKDIESILFLNQADDNKQAKNGFVITGLAQGKFDIVYEKDKQKVIRDASSANQINIKAVNENKIVSNRQSVYLSDFEQQLESLIK